jgi:hypothetical protein
MDSWPQGHRHEDSRTGQKALALSTSSLLLSRAESVTRHSEVSPYVLSHTAVRRGWRPAEIGHSPIPSLIYLRMQLKFGCVLILTDHFPDARTIKYSKIQSK